eukprot:TRINITY_DN8745_c0_g1_i1.p1 TRINITY_DN8745_c0_g1~~TRINITY_DN8745_c0_g1_i1.p1  ORF type:complete len:320 (-),score=69.66 TRINITY_DN8745_c0_g1_i1:6-965(-)
MNITIHGESGVSPELQQWLDESGSIIDTWTLEQIKAVKDSKPDDVSLDSVNDIEIPVRDGYQVSTRVYVPFNCVPDRFVYYIHGGGWTRGNPDSYNLVGYHLANMTGCKVIMPDYRLAPEFVFPCGANDVYDVLAYFVREETESQFVICGDSGGATWTILSCHWLIENGLSERLAAIVPVYPSVELYEMDSDSYRMYAKGHWLTRSIVQKFRNWLLFGSEDLDEDRKEMLKDPEVSLILLSDEYYKKFPRTRVVTAECDVLFSECKAFAERLYGLGVDVDYVQYNGAIHAFFSALFPSLEETTLKAISDVADFIKSVLK